MLFKSKTLLTLLFFLFFLSQSKAQKDANSKALDKIKDGHTYVVVNDLNFPGSVEFLRVLKKYWTLTKGVDYLNASDLKANLKAGDSYFSIVTYFMNNGAGGSAVFYYLSLWIPTEKSLREDRKFDIKDQNEIADIYVAVHANVGERIGVPVLPFDGAGRISNWNPGTLKNNLQQLTAWFQTGRYLSNDKADKEQLKLLKDQTLYVPDENFYTTTFFYKTGRYNDAEIANIFSGYKANYKVITSRELGDRILADTEPFFYLLHITQTGRGTITEVVNSRTGEIIYSSHHVTFSHNLDSGDLKDLYKKVKKD